MTSRTHLIAAALTLGLFASGSPAIAQESGQARPPGSGAPDRHGGMMMQGQGGMMGMMGGIDMAQMNRMMENCNRLMESRLQDRQQAPGSTAPAPETKG